MALPSAQPGKVAIPVSSSDRVVRVSEFRQRFIEHIIFPAVLAEVLGSHRIVESGQRVVWLCRKHTLCGQGMEQRFPEVLVVYYNLPVFGSYSSGKMRIEVESIEVAVCAREVGPNQILAGRVVEPVL